MSSNLIALSPTTVMWLFLPTNVAAPVGPSLARTFPSTVITVPAALMPPLAILNVPLLDAEPVMVISCPGKNLGYQSQPS